MTQQSWRESIKEPRISIEGVLFDLESGIMSHHEALNEIMMYFSEQRGEMVEMVKSLNFSKDYPEAPYVKKRKEEGFNLAKNEILSILSPKPDSSNNKIT